MEKIESAFGLLLANVQQHDIPTVDFLNLHREFERQHYDY